MFVQYGWAVGLFSLFSSGLQHCIKGHVFLTTKMAFEQRAVRSPSYNRLYNSNLTSLCRNGQSWSLILSMLECIEWEAMTFLPLCHQLKYVV